MSVNLYIQRIITCNRTDSRWSKDLSHRKIVWVSRMHLVPIAFGRSPIHRDPTWAAWWHGGSGLRKGTFRHGWPRVACVHAPVRSVRRSPCGSQPHPRTKISGYLYRCAAWSANEQLANQWDRSIQSWERCNERIEAFDTNGLWLPSLMSSVRSIGTNPGVTAFFFLALPLSTRYQ